MIHEVDVDVPAGKTIGLVGESGSGKSTLARVLVGQLHPSVGQVLLGDVAISGLRGRRLRAVRRRIQLVPQDPYASLDPRMSVRRALYEAIDPHGRRLASAKEQIATLLQTVALDPSAADRYPHEFSGGQRQRVAIARALAVEPEVMIADEVTSSLDTSVQAEILNLLQSIQQRTGISMVFITHDLSVANYLCDEIYVLYLGRVVERGTTRLLFHPDHPYTRLLVDSVPGSGSGAVPERATAVEEAPDPTKPPPGCPFHPRCLNGPRYHAGREACIATRPALAQRWASGPADGARSSACHFPLAEAPD